MANFVVKDAYGSVITIQSSTFGSAERQAVQAFIGGGTVSIVGTTSTNPASVQVLNPVSLLAVNPNPSSVFVLNPVSVLAVNPNPSSVFVLNPVSILGVTQSGAWSASTISIIAPTSSVMSLATAASTTTMLASNSARRGAMVSNNSATSIMVKLGAMANSGDFTLLMQNTDYYEVPFNYSGRIDYFASSVAGVIKVTEIT